MKTQTQFGGGLMSPQILAHVKRSGTAKPVTRTEFGAGLIAPAVTAHVKRTKLTFGGGLIHPRVARAFAR